MRRITGVLVCGSVGEQQAQEIELNVQYELMDRLRNKWST